MSRELPPSVEMLHVTLIENGIPASTMSFSRTDLERLEHRPAREALAAARFTDTLRFGDYPDPFPTTYPRFEWSIGPYLRTSLFDPGNPLRADIGIRAKAKYHLGSGWIVSGSVGQKVIGNLDGAVRPNNSQLPQVRSDVDRYNRTDEPFIENLTVAKYGRLWPDFYSRVTAGYLERMYAGISGEVLWKPVDSRLALGAEINYTHPRDFDQQFGLRSRVTPGGTIPEFNGHVSAYYDFGNGFHGGRCGPLPGGRLGRHDCAGPGIRQRMENRRIRHLHRCFGQPVRRGVLRQGHPVHRATVVAGGYADKAEGKRRPAPPHP